jgi:hypothetical protein
VVIAASYFGYVGNMYRSSLFTAHHSPSTDFQAHRLDVNIDRTSTGQARVSLAVFSVEPTGTPATTLTKVADAQEVYSPTTSPVWYSFTFAQPIKFQAGQAYMIGVYMLLGLSIQPFLHSCWSSSYPPRLGDDMPDTLVAHAGLDKHANGHSSWRSGP